MVSTKCNFGFLKQKMTIIMVTLTECNKTHDEKTKMKDKPNNKQQTQLEGK